MGDRLEEVIDRWPPESQDGPWSQGDPRADIAWLVREVHRLRAEVAYLRDHPGWVPPIPERREPQ